MKDTVIMSPSKLADSKEDNPAMEFLKKIISSNDFGLRQKFPWDNSISAACMTPESSCIKSCVSDAEKKYLAEVIQCVFKKKTPLKIERLQNPFLWGRYVLQYEEMKTHSYSKHVSERIMIHATSRSNAEKIAETNFDWRLVNRARFGKGVSFAKHAQYARCFADKKEVFIVAGVIVANGIRGVKNQEIPKNNNDVTTGYKKKNVCVKYHDNDFYPYYIVEPL